jgi:hypothetical protein
LIDEEVEIGMPANTWILSAGFLVLVLILAVWVAKLHGDVTQLSNRLKPPPQRRLGAELGRSGLDLLDETSARLDEVDRLSRALGGVVRHCIQRIGLVRFDAFNEAAGEQSFALAVLDEDGSGVILSSLHARAGSRIYAKPVENGKSIYALSDEEEAALRSALAGRTEVFKRENLSKLNRLGLDDEND